MWFRKHNKNRKLQVKKQISKYNLRDKVLLKNGIMGLISGIYLGDEPNADGYFDYVVTTFDDIRLKSDTYFVKEKEIKLIKII